MALVTLLFSPSAIAKLFSKPMALTEISFLWGLGGTRVYNVFTAILKFLFSFYLEGRGTETDRNVLTAGLLPPKFTIAGVRIKLDLLSGWH